MTIIQQRQYSRFERTTQFVDSHAGDFAPNSKALSVSNELKEVVANFEAAGQEQKSTNTGTRSYTSAKLTALNALREDLVAIADTAKVIAASNPKFKNTFVLPDRRRKNELADAARQFIKDAQRSKGEFEALEMSPDFLDQLNTRLQAYEAAQSGQGTPAGEKVVATDAVSDLVARGAELVEALNVMVRNKYRGQTEVLSEWADAYNLEFTPRRKKGERAAEKAAKK